MQAICIQMFLQKSSWPHLHGMSQPPPGRVQPSMPPAWPHNRGSLPPAPAASHAAYTSGGAPQTCMYVAKICLGIASKIC